MATPSRRTPSPTERPAPARPSRFLPSSAMADGALRVGRIVGSHGLRGALRVRTDDAESTALSSVARVFIDTPDGRREFTVETVTALGRRQLRMTLEGIDGVDAAELLRGCDVMVATNDLPPLNEGEFYYFQLIGAEVMLTDGRRLGTIEDVFSAGAQDTWVVRDGAREVLVPVIADVVKKMDLDGRRVTIEPLPGLLD